MKTHLVFNDVSERVEYRDLSLVMCVNALKLVVMQQKSHQIGSY